MLFFLAMKNQENKNRINLLSPNLEFLIDQAGIVLFQFYLNRTLFHIPSLKG